MIVGNNLAIKQLMVTGSMEQTNRQLRNTIERLATGQRINRASDDAAGLAISEGLLSQVRGFKMASRNTHDGISALNIADGAANETSNMLQRQRELAIQASNATLNDSQRQSLNREFQQLSQEIDRVAQATNFNGQNLTNGEGLGDGNARIQVGPNATANDGITTPHIDISATSLGVGTADISTAAGATAALSSIDGSLQSLGEQRSNIGATTNRFEHTVNNLQTATVNTAAAQSLIRDQDMALGIAELLRKQVLNQAASSTFSVFNRISSDNILGLIR
ncbi:MAG: flagellin FliC [Chitinivibrionia bacterium]|nr:flagellin FliC [Chitinivibrionia bacterium]